MKSHWTMMRLPWFQATQTRCLKVHLTPTHVHTYTLPHTHTHTHAHTDAGVGGWVIDTAGKNRTRLSLPPPTNQPESHDQSHDSAPVSHDQPREEASHDQPKIKRRNIALYSMPAQSDDEEDT